MTCEPIIWSTVSCWPNGQQNITDRKTIMWGSFCVFTTYRYLQNSQRYPGLKLKHFLKKNSFLKESNVHFPLRVFGINSNIHDNGRKHSLEYSRLYSKFYDLFYVCETLDLIEIIFTWILIYTGDFEFELKNPRKDFRWRLCVWMINPYNRDTVVFFSVRESSNFGQMVAKPPWPPRRNFTEIFFNLC